MIVADASILLKWFVEEEDRSHALELRQRHLEGRDIIAAPELVFYEVANAFVCRTQLPPSEIEENLNQLLAYRLEVASWLELLNVASIARKYSLTIYDASYAALAQALRCRLVTADERLLARLKGMPHVHHLREVVQ